MFSALKKLVGSETPVPQREKNIPAGLQSMNQSLQRRFAKGVQYNMKIVIRGDRNTGKSTLWQRLQGGKFQEEYIPTQEIQVTSIHWNYKTTDDVVKVEVWDVVDKGRGKKRADTLKLENDPQEAENEMALDAEFLDVYKNCNGVIMMFDITKQWTYNYILRELPRVPTHVPVCVLGNHRDMGEHRVILPDDIRDFINSLNRPLGSSYIHYAESSMKNGFGLKYLHRFFNIPFLQLQRETLLRQLETNQLDIDATLEELTVQQETEDQNYEIFLEMMEARAKGYRSPGDANGQSPSSGSQSPVVPAGASSTGSSSPGTPQQPPVIGQNPQLPSTSPPVSVDAQIPVALPPASAPAPSPAQQPQKRSFISRLFGSTAAPETPTSVLETEPSAPRAPATVQSVDDFVPDEGLDKSFLEDSVPSGTKPGMNTQPQTTAGDSDSDGEGRGGNPMVAGFQDDLDPDDAAPIQQPRSSVPSKDLNITLSSDEEEIASKPVVAKDEDLDIQLDSHLDDFSSLALEEKPKLAKPVPSVQPPMITEPSILTPTPVHMTHTPHTHSPPKRGKVKAPAPQGDTSDTDPEAPVAQQMLSFVMDDPDFESEEEHVQKDKKDGHRIRSDLPDLSDEELVPAEPLKSSGRSFKHKNDSDLFGLGFEEKSIKSKESSDEQDEKESKHSTKEKKKKKKKSKEDEEKSSKKKKHKKKEREEPEGAGDEKEKKKKKSRSKKAGDLDDLEAFLAGGEASEKREEGDYEEL
ncbi:rab-like protein 6 isoform X2 [Hemibagrus wyckioides]|uniref:rab-like protein 6 isoform X2 n=1 Tax=Hemibagrus wyckioides TaxID=337641 RepID=UPI00266D7A8F|nr:rab-like protein 6 isoform X2 [Hemibagrus wyckioides]